MAKEIAAVIDTSAIIQLREEWYSPDVFHSLNQEVTRAAEQRYLITVDRVISELETQAKDQSRNVRHNGVLTASWAKETVPALDDVVPLRISAEIRTLTSAIATQHQTWRNGQPADPMLLAAAEILGCAIVSGESLRIMDPDDPKPISGTGQIWNQDGIYSSWIRIPDVCLMRSIPHLDLLAFFRSQRWSF